MSGPVRPFITTTFGGGNGDRAVAQDLMEAAQQTCPYSKATRGTINATINVTINVTINLVQVHCPSPRKPARSPHVGRMFWDQRRDSCRGKAAF